MPPFIDMTGVRYGRLTAIKRVKNSKHSQTMWMFRCECGKEIVTTGWAVRSGHTTSCGCFLSETTASLKYSHGMARTRIYKIYQHMKERCYKTDDRAYGRYGGRGITICDEWLEENGFENFYNWSILNGYNETLTIDRIDVNGNYEPSNCRWATWRVQANNKRNNRYVTYNGKTKTVSEWSQEYGIGEATIRSRLNRGWSVDETLNIPTKRKRGGVNGS